MSEERRDILRVIIQEEMKPLLEQLARMEREIKELKHLVKA